MSLKSYAMVHELDMGPSIITTAPGEPRFFLSQLTRTTIANGAIAITVFYTERAAKSADMEMEMEINGLRSIFFPSLSGLRFALIAINKGNMNMKRREEEGTAFVPFS